MWQTPVTDRTQDDVDYAKVNYSLDLPEQFKAAQNHTDWNRLSINMYYVANVLTNYGFQIRLNGNPSRGLHDIPSVSEINDYREDLKTIRHALHSFDSYTWEEFDMLDQTWDELDDRGLEASEYFSRHPIPELPYNYFEKINIIEEISLALYEVVQAYGNLFRVSGTFASGQLSYLPRFIEPHVCDMIWLEWDLMDRTWDEIDAEERTADVYFNKCFDPELDMTWDDWDELDRTWQEIDDENRTAEQFFWRRING